MSVENNVYVSCSFFCLGTAWSSLAHHIPAVSGAAPAGMGTERSPLPWETRVALGPTVFLGKRAAGGRMLLPIPSMHCPRSLWGGAAAG